MQIEFQTNAEFFTAGQSCGEVSILVKANVRFAETEWDEDLRELITTGEDEVEVIGCWIGCEELGGAFVGGAAINPRNINGAFYETIKRAAIIKAVEKIDGEYIAEQMALNAAPKAAHNFS